MKLELNHDSEIPLHIQVENIIRDLIKKDNYKNGEMLPKEEDLARRFAVSRNTVRHAFDKLVYEGLLVRKKGKGTTVALQTVSTRLDSWLSFTNEMKLKGIEVKNYEISTSLIKCNSELAKTFDIPEGKEILKLVRLRGTVERPIVYFISYFHPRVGLKGTEDFSAPLYQLLEKECSVVASLSREEISAQKADKEIAAKLLLKPGDPVLFRKRHVYDPGKRIIEYNLGYYRADSFTYSIDIKRENI